MLSNGGHNRRFSQGQAAPDLSLSPPTPLPSYISGPKGFIHRGEGWAPRPELLGEYKMKTNLTRGEPDGQTQKDPCRLLKDQLTRNYSKNLPGSTT